MDPISAIVLSGAVSTGGSFLSGMMGADAQRETGMWNYYANLANIHAQQQARQEAMAFAERDRSERQLGSTNASGDRTYFVPGQGWVTDLSAESQGLHNMQRAEQGRILSEDLPRAREQMRTNARRQGEEEYIAGGLRDEFSRIQRMMPNEMEGLIYGASARGINEGHDETLRNAMRSAIRSGASNSGAVLSDLARARARDLGDASLKARLSSREMAQQDFDGQRKGVSNLYNFFATRAGAMPSATFRPENLDDESGRMTMAKIAADGGGNVMKAAQMSPGSFDYIQPWYGDANTVKNTAQGLSGMFNNLGQQNMYYDALRTRQNNGSF